jgi:hypothetical protein
MRQGKTQRNRSRGAHAPEFCSPPRRLRKKVRPRPIKGGEAPKGACQPLPRAFQTSACETRITRLRTAARRYRWRARLPALRPRLSPGTPVPAQLQAMLPGTRNQAGVSRLILSQSSDSTSRLGRSTEGPDARSRSGADCEPARKHRTRSTLRIASGMRPLLSEIR